MPSNPEPKQDTSVRGSPTTSPSISQPKGGGAIRGMGEKFAANPVSGTGSMSVPISTSPGRSGFGPQLVLSYDSGAGNGPFGFGWNLSLPAITRKTDKGLPQYQNAYEEDVFILSGAEDLVPVLVDDGGGEWVREELPPRTLDGKQYQIQRHRPRVEGLFARIERWTNPADPAGTFWRSISRDNITTWYGKTENSRIADPADPSRIFSWLICESHDDKGNIIVYDYKAEDSAGVVNSLAHERNRTDESRSANRYLKRIRYGNRMPYFPERASEPQFLPSEWLFEVVLDYSEHDPDQPTPEDSSPWPVRLDPFSSYRAGFEVRTYRLCQRVLMFHRFSELGEEPCLVRSTDFTYSYEDNPQNARNPIFSFLNSATQSGYKRRADGSYLSKALPPLEFTYSQPIIQQEVHEVDPESLKNLPNGLDGRRYQWVDLDGEGLSGIMTEQGGGWFYKRNLGPINGGEEPVAQFGPVERAAAKPSQSAMGTGRSQFMDLAGDGQLDLVALERPTPGFYERTQDEDWESFVPFKSLPVLDWANPNLRFVDLTGDGHADILISQDEVFCWYLSLGEAGFGPAEKVKKVLDEEKGPNLVFADRTQSIYLADISGDGLVDLVRVRNGEVCYWPNLGYGRFGTKVTMDNAPWFDHPDLFDQHRIRLADIDGSGTTDIFYLADDGVCLYFNQSGNSWSSPQWLTAFPPVDDLSSVQVADLFGNGTACLVWSSSLQGDAHSPMRYVDLMGGQKPHLLIRSVNNLGAETIVSYAPSTRFYLADKLAGKPWITKIPFPVHVVERVDTFDRISGNRFVTRYAYHHGYFDGVEREFRGFGLVEQWDTEEFAALSESQQFPTGTNIDESSHVPPVLTRTWFHTGTYLGRDHVSNFYAGLIDETDIGEYYREPELELDDDQAKALLLEDTVLPDGLTVEEERQACRALKGAMLRQEVYALDGPDKEPHPYVVTEQNFTIKRLQPTGDNRHAVFFTHAREALSYQYERIPDDPRIGHALTLKVDEFGNVLTSASVGYGRRQPDPTLSGDDQDKQTQTLITITENGFTNPVELDDDYRTPLPAEARTYELTGLELANGQNRFSLDALLDAGDNAVPLAYEVAPSPGEQQKRLIEHVRTRYRPNDLGSSLADPLALLPLGQTESLALPGESYKLAFTPGLVAQAYGDKVTGTMIESEGRYVHSEGDVNWWIPSGRIFFSPGTNDPPEVELAYARDHFFLPHRFRDPFHSEQVPTESFITYDTYDLLLQETRNALDNRVTVGERDAAGNLTTPGHDYRVLQPALTMGPNRNRTAVVFDALGMVVGTAVMGKPLPAPVEGDSLEGFDPDLGDAVMAAHLEDPFTDPHTILGGATTRLVYDLFAYHRTKNQSQPQPAVVYSLARETHASDLENGELTKIQHSFSYSDGFGREIQKKIQAEPGPLIEEGPEVDPRWVGSGWTIFNNKGKPVRQFEPFFTATHRFESDVRVGVSPILFYDPVQRVVATLNPNHTWQKVVFDPWWQETWDVNDTALIEDPKSDPDVADFFSRFPEAYYLPTWYGARIDGAMGIQEQAAAHKTELHANTPAVAYMDSLGRTFLTVAHNKFERNKSDGSVETVEEKYPTHVVLDIEGNQRDVTDAKGRSVMRYDYDMLGSQIRSTSMDAGERWMLNNVAGKPIRAWDARGHEFRTEYDQLYRPIRQFVHGTDADQSDPRVLTRDVLFGKIEYGEGQSNDIAFNMRTRAYMSFDNAGVISAEEYDFKGNLLRGNRQLAADYKGIPDWAGVVDLESELFASSTTYDALNRPISLVSPDNSEIKTIYSEANLLERVTVNLRGETRNGEKVWTDFVEDIDYNAKGQRERIEYGNGVGTTYDYDPLTFRLVSLKTTRNTEGTLQNLAYTFDPAGNITFIKDEAQQTTFFANTKVTPDTDYSYDAINQLIKASGREHIGQIGQVDHNDPPIHPLPHPNNIEAMRSYTESYEYDAVGNIRKMIHQANEGSWTRHYQYAADSNRLLATSLPDDHPDGPYTDEYEYNIHGSMARMPHLSFMAWDFAERLQASSRQVFNEGNPETTYYVYDAAGQRVRKVTDRQAEAGQMPRRMKERVYLGGFETYREYDGTGTNVMLERETLHVMDDKQRIALVETKTVDSGSPLASHASLMRYQLGNHLGSASLELDGAAHIISYEEYHPYGTTSYRSMDSAIEVSAKRYRYTGKEKDEETGLYYHGARYYAAWLGRWCSVDPRPDQRSYVYAANSPVLFHDPDGKAIQFGLIVGGVVVGGGVGAAVGLWREWDNPNGIDWATVGSHAVGGAVSGGIAGATGGLSLAAEGTIGTVGSGSLFLAGEASASMVGGTLTRTLLGQETTPEDLTYDAAIGAGTAGVLRGAGKMLSTYLKGGDVTEAAKETITEVVEQTKAAQKEAASTVRPLGDEFIDDLIPDEITPGSFNPNVAKRKLLEEADDRLIQRTEFEPRLEPFGAFDSPEISLSGHGLLKESFGYTTIPENTWLNVFGEFGDRISNNRGNFIETGFMKPLRTYGPGEQVPDLLLLPPFSPKGDLSLLGNPIYTIEETGVRLSEIFKTPNLGPVNWAACMNTPPK